MQDFIPVFYTPAMTVASNASYSPSAGKPSQVVADWKFNGLPIHVIPPEPVSVRVLNATHDPEFVNGIMRGKRMNGFGNADPAIAASLLWTVGSMVSASRHVLERGGVACSPTSGFHHAGHDFAGGFCTFNGLMAAAVDALMQDYRSQIVIIDEDTHSGNGTDDILDVLKLRDKVSHYTLGEREVDDDGEACLARLARFLSGDVDEDTSLVIYQAGADAHIDDPLGGVYTTEQMALRDRMVFDHCRKLGVPLIWGLAGGYKRDEHGGIEPVLALHRQTMQICAEVYGE